MNFFCSILSVKIRSNDQSGDMGSIKKLVNHSIYDFRQRSYCSILILLNGDCNYIKPFLVRVVSWRATTSVHNAK